MEIKKTPKADLENKKGLFLEIGLIIALGVCILMFSWSQKEKVVVKMTDDVAIVEQEIVEITRQEEPPKAPQAKTISVTADILRVVKDDAKITTNIDFSEFSEDLGVEVAPPATVEEEMVEEEEIFLIAETMPTFEGGDVNSFRTWVQSRLKYPIVAQENNIQGRVVVTFVVGKDGSVGHIQVLASPDKSLAAEAVRVIESSPKWTPGKQRGNPVQIRINLPVDFQIQ